MIDALWEDFLAVAILACAVFSAVGFNRPTWSRTCTTASRYYCALAAHIVLHVVLLLAVYAALRRAFSVSGTGDYDSLLSVGLVWLSLAITLAVRALTRRPRVWLHRLAGIPAHAQRTATLLANGELHAPEAVLQEARAMLQSRGIDCEPDWLPIAQPTYRLLLKATALFIQIRAWEQNRTFTRFVVEAKNDLDLLRRRFDRLSLKVSRTLASVERLGEVRSLFPEKHDDEASAPVDALLRKIVKDLMADSCEDISAFYDDACLLAARAAMATRRTAKGRRSLLAALGFELKHGLGTSGYGVLVPTALLLYCGMWVFFLILPHDDSALKIDGLVAVASLIVFGSIAIAVVPKLRWGFANAGLRDRTPAVFVAGAGVCAIVFTLIVDCVAGALLIGGPEGAFQLTHDAVPWLPSIGVIASATAWLVQDHRWRTTASSRLRRLQDAGAFGVVWFVAAIMGSLLEVAVGQQPHIAPEMLRTAIGSLAFGAVVGCAVPESVRFDDVRRAYQRAAAARAFNILETRPVGA